MATSAPATAAGAPAGPEQVPKGRLRLIFAGLMLGMLVASLDQTIVSTALPVIVKDLGGMEHIAWVTTAYLLASTVSTPLWGKLGDLIGRKRLYQTSIVIFLIGSVLCGIADDMGQLIAYRAIQGLGGGGLMTLSMAIIADVVPPRERGRYQGLFASVFGLSAVAGPLLGGFFTEHVNWRWVFYVNVPIGVIALVVIAFALNAHVSHAKPVIDYVGVGVLAAATTLLVLMTTFGGTTYAWDSWQIVGMGVVSLVLIGAFVVIERRAAEPVLPPHLFGLPVFRLMSAISFVVGFAMMGAMAYIPLYMQIVNGATPTDSGLRIIPLMGGMLVTSITVGRLITRTGHYKLFPVFGTLVMCIGMFLMSRMDEYTTTMASSLYMIVFGIGLGAVMPVLVLAVQNSVDYKDLGTATSGTTFFRSIGGCFGVAVFGAILNNKLNSGLADAKDVLPPGFTVEMGSSPAGQSALSPEGKAAFLHAYTQALQPVFLWAAAIIVLAFLLSLLIRESPLRSANKAPTPEESMPMAGTTARDSAHEIECAMAHLVQRENGWARYESMIARAGVAVSVPEAYGLVQLNENGPVTPVELAGRLREPVTEVERHAGTLIGQGLVTKDPEDRLLLTDGGRTVLDKLIGARREALAELLADYSPEQSAELAALLDKLAKGTTFTAKDHIVSEAAKRAAP